MGVRILVGDPKEHDSEDTACFYCSTTGWAFGPIMQSQEEAEMFLQFLGGIDPRTLRDKELEAKFYEFRSATIQCSVCRRDVPYTEWYTDHIDSHPCE